jgi:hypothetical protein
VLTRPRELAEDPAAVASRSAESCRLRLEDDDVERRVGAAQLVGGPQAGVAAADDADVGLARAGERRAGRRGGIELRAPERDRRTLPCCRAARNASRCER